MVCSDGNTRCPMKGSHMHDPIYLLKSCILPRPPTVGVGAFRTLASSLPLSLTTSPPPLPKLRPSGGLRDRDSLCPRPSERAPHSGSGPRLRGRRARRALVDEAARKTTLGGRLGEARGPNRESSRSDLGRESRGVGRGKVSWRT